MKQREVTDNENTTWTCVQAFSMTEQKTPEKAEALSETEDGKVTVVCTPNGGARTARLELPHNWQDEMNDQSLIEAINNMKQ